MELNELGKRELFQVEGDCQAKILSELHALAQYTTDIEQSKAASSLMKKLRTLSDRECMDLVKDIQKNYHLPYPPRSVGEMLAEARQKSGAEKLKGHDIMALERFDPDVCHMIIFEVLSNESPMGSKGDRMRLFLTEEGYRKALENQEKGYLKIKNHANVFYGSLRYDHKDRSL